MLVTIINLINGRLRTSKYLTLHRMIKFMDQDVPLQAIDTTPLSQNSWLAGFIDADGNFNINYNVNSSGDAINIKPTFRLTQAKYNQVTLLDNFDFLHTISTFLGVNLILTNRNDYLIRTSSISANLTLITYLNNFPIFSSKYQDYQAYKETFDYARDKKAVPNLTSRLEELKGGMNNSRTKFNWDHLDYFYK